MTKKRANKYPVLIKSMEEVLDIANKGGSVYVTVWNRHSAAAFLTSWPVRLLDRFVKMKALYKK